MLELKQVSSGYGGETKLFNISLSVPDQAILSIIGPNGCGKSTLLRSISGMQRPYSGSILLDGVPLHCVGRNDLAKRISYLPQSRNIPSITVSSMVLHGRFPYMGYPRRYRPDDKKIAEQAMEWAGILSLRDKEMALLSGGEQQKVYIAMVLVQNTKTVLLDEPTTYLDIRHQLEIMHLVRKMRAEGKTVVMVLHDLNLALTYSDRVAVMQDGCLSAYGIPDDIYRSGVLNDVFGVRVIAQKINGMVHYFFETP